MWSGEAEAVAFEEEAFAGEAEVACGALDVAAVAGEGALDPVWCTSSESRIRCPDRWQTHAKAAARAGSSMTTLEARRSAWCSTSARALGPPRETWRTEQTQTNSVNPSTEADQG